MNLEIKTVKKKIGDLVPAKYNPRKISDDSLAGLKTSMTKFGYVEPIVWNKRTGNVVGGHQRLKILANEAKGKEIDVVEVDLPAKDEKALNVALNNRHIQGEWDTDMLLPLLDEIKDLPEFDELRLDDLRMEFGNSELDPNFKEFNENITDGESVMVTIKIKIPQEEAGNFEEELDEILKNYPNAVKENKI